MSIIAYEGTLQHKTGTFRYGGKRQYVWKEVGTWWVRGSLLKLLDPRGKGSV